MKYFLVALFVFIFFNAQSQEIELDSITVSASLHESPASKTGRNIISIPGNYFEKLPVHSIDDLLRYIPGVEVQQRGPAGSQADIVLRGGTFQQVLIILDGLRLNDPNTGHFNSYIPIAPTEIERIEVLKGASSGIYGSEAVGGVIHIITKSFGAIPIAIGRKQGKKQFRISATGGEYEVFNAGAGAFIQENNTILAGGILSNNSSGQPQRGTRGSFHNTTASLSFKQFIGEHFSIAGRSSYDQRRFAAQNFYTTFLSDTAAEEVTTYWNQINIGYQKGRHHINFNSGYKHVKDNYRYNPSSIANDNKSNLMQLLLTDNYKLSDKTNFTAGIQFLDKTIRSNDRGNHSLSQFAAFLILDQKLGKLSFSPSLRMDNYILIPQINLSYHIDKLQLRASAGKTIRDADFTERYNNYNKSFVSGGSIGNPDLEAERSLSYEAGADYFVNTKLKISVSAFQRRQSHLIDWVTTSYAQMPRKSNLSPTGTYALSQNIAKVTTTGIESDLQYRSIKFLATLGLLWLESKSSNATPSFYISSHARFLANFNTEYRVNRFAISFSGLYKNRKPQKASAINAEVDENCFMLNTKASFHFFKQKLSFFAEVDNVLDNDCGDLLGPRPAGRWIMGGFNLSL